MNKGSILKFNTSLSTQDQEKALKTPTYHKIKISQITDAPAKIKEFSENITNDSILSSLGLKPVISIDRKSVV